MKLPGRVPARLLQLYCLPGVFPAHGEFRTRRFSSAGTAYHFATWVSQNDFCCPAAGFAGGPAVWHELPGMLGERGRCLYMSRGKDAQAGVRVCAL